MYPCWSDNDVLKLLYYSQLCQVPNHGKGEDFQWNSASQHILVQLPVQRRVKNSKLPKRIISITRVYFWTIQKIVCAFRNYDIQEPQCFEVAKRGWNRAAECILFKFQFLKARQIAQWWRYRPCQVVLVQPPEEHQCINNLEIVRIQHSLIKSIWKIL